MTTKYIYAYSSALEKKGGGLPDLLSIASFNGCIQEANLIDCIFYCVFDCL